MNKCKKQSDIDLTESVQDGKRNGSDLISRQAAIDVFGDVHPLDYNAQTYLGKIKALPSAQPEWKTGKWISCSEGYPEMDERVLVNLDGRDDIHAWDCMSNRGDSYFWEDEVGFFHDKYEVLYWMRIPRIV